VALRKAVAAETFDLAESLFCEVARVAVRLYAMLPRVRITDLLAEVAGWTGFVDCFTHLRTGETAANSRILMAGLLADGLNPGLTRMAEACSITSLGQLAWTADWHVRDETYALALRCLVNRQQREPFATVFGNGTASSSDGQFFQAAGFGRDTGYRNAHYGPRPGFKIYTHISGRYGPFYTKLIAATASEALHVLDALLYHQSEVAPHRHHTDGGGDSEHVFALCALLGFQFAPRIPNLKHRRLYSFGKPSATPTLEPMIAGRINIGLIRAHWPDILRVVASIRTGTVTASLIMRQLAAYQPAPRCHWSCGARRVAAPDGIRRAGPGNGPRRRHRARRFRAQRHFRHGAVAGHPARSVRHGAENPPQGS
jgi:hypothetical protein